MNITIEKISDNKLIRNMESIISISESKNIEIMILYKNVESELYESDIIYGEKFSIDIIGIDFSDIHSMFHTHPYNALLDSSMFNPERSIKWIERFSEIDNMMYDYDAIRFGLFPYYHDINCAVHNNLKNMIIGNKFGIIIYEIDNTLPIETLKSAVNLERKRFAFRRSSPMYKMCDDYITMTDKLHYDLSYRYVHRYNWIKKYY